MKQNIYDDPQFFERYSAMPRSLEGLRQAGEWHELRAMLPTLKDKTVLDLGCGFGWHCRHAVEQGAAHVIGVDLSENMLRRAAEINGGPGIEYRRAAIEDIDFAPESFDLVLRLTRFALRSRPGCGIRESFLRVEIRRRLHLFHRASRVHGAG